VQQSTPRNEKKNAHKIRKKYRNMQSYKETSILAWALPALGLASLTRVGIGAS
jgi:hypothetical protein